MIFPCRLDFRGPNGHRCATSPGPALRITPAQRVAAALASPSRSKQGRRLSFGPPQGSCRHVRSRAPKSGSSEFRAADFLSISKQHFHRVAYTEWGDPNSARILICVHGLSRQGRDFDALAQALAAHGYRVICPDLVGRGRSGRLSDPDDYALPQYAVDMTMLIARLGVDRVDWIGTSLGGLVGIVLAGMPQSPIRRLVINDIGPFLPWTALRRIGDNVREAPRDFTDLAAVDAYFRDVHAPFGDL